MIGVSESWALERHIEELLELIEPSETGTQSLSAVLARSLQGESTLGHLPVRLRAGRSEDTRLHARVGPCGPPAANLIVLSAPRRSRAVD